MYNYCMLIGTVVQKEMKDNETIIYLSVQKPFKNEKGEYSKDIFPIYCYNFLNEVISEKLLKGSKVGIKGRLEKNEQNVKIIAEKIMFV